MADNKDPSACPVDHKTRDAWLAQARAAAAVETPSTSSTQPSCPVNHAATETPSTTWTQTLTALLPWPTSLVSPPAAPKTPPARTPAVLDTSRVVSTIPRSTSSPLPVPVPVPDAATTASSAANHEMETGADPSGKWVYPSEKMFFDAMKRKGYDARALDMKTVVPIHNAVNERAWEQIRQWEAPYLPKSCDGPKLESFANRNDRMTPTARVNTILGYTAPFDRHDWVIDRCGTRVDYVIDFYAGRPDAAGRPGPSFYLDVRPKLNTWEGVKMRAMRWAGLA